MADLTEKQKRFADYYIESGNATDAYQRAYGCKRETADANGTRMLGNARVLQYIESRNQQLANKRIADMQEVKEFWSSVLRSSEVEMKDRLKASEFIAKTNAAFIDRHEHSGETGVRIVNDIPRTSSQRAFG